MREIFRNLLTVRPRRKRGLKKGYVQPFSVRRSSKSEGGRLFKVLINPVFNFIADFQSANMCLCVRLYFIQNDYGQTAEGRGRCKATATNEVRGNNFYKHMQVHRLIILSIIILISCLIPRPQDIRFINKATARAITPAKGCDTYRRRPGGLDINTEPHTHLV